MPRKPCTDCEHHEQMYLNRYIPNDFDDACDSCEKYKKYQKYLESKRKFCPGETIYSVDVLLLQKFVMMRGKPTHIEFVKSLPFRTVIGYLDYGCFEKAIRNDV